MTILRFPALYRRHFRDHRRERMFLASLSFFITFGVTRLVTYSQRGRLDPLQISIGDVHIHHLVWGILLLLIVGYAWLIQIGTGSDGRSARFGRVTALLFGVGAALTLDEFALWLNLEDVYWQREGRISVDAALLFGGLVSVGLWGGPFLRGATRQLGRLVRRLNRRASRSGARAGHGSGPPAFGGEPSRPRVRGAAAPRSGRPARRGAAPPRRETSSRSS